MEVSALFGSPLVPGGIIANPGGSWITINAQVQMTQLVDLTNVPGAHAPLSTTAQELTGDWKGYSQRSAKTTITAPTGVAPTQGLGAALYTSARFEGFLAISAKMPYQKVMGVFPNRILRGNFIRYSYVDAAGQRQTLQIP
jgi:hypothetical protein